jgi:hypothetical protein
MCVAWFWTLVTKERFYTWSIDAKVIEFLALEVFLEAIEEFHRSFFLLKKGISCIG